MRRPTTVAPLVALLVSSMLAALPAHAAAADAPAKQRLCTSCKKPTLPVVLPSRGMVLAYGSFLATGSLWFTVDLERKEVSRILANYDRTAQKLVVTRQATRPLPPDTLARLTEISNDIWSSTDRLPTLMATDVTWDLWQIDGDDLRRDFGPGRPGGLAQEAARIMERVVPEHAAD